MLGCHLSFIKRNLKDCPQNFNREKLEMDMSMVQRRVFSVTAMLEELGWPILSKRRKDVRLILFYKIINNLAQVPHEHILTKAYEGTRKKNNYKFRHIGFLQRILASIGSHFSPKLQVHGIS